MKIQHKEHNPTVKSYSISLIVHAIILIAVLLFFNAPVFRENEEKRITVSYETIKVVDEGGKGGNEGASGRRGGDNIETGIANKKEKSNPKKENAANVGLQEKVREKSNNKKRYSDEELLFVQDIETQNLIREEKRSIQEMPTQNRREESLPDITALLNEESEIQKNSGYPVMRRVELAYSGAKRIEDMQIQGSNSRSSEPAETEGSSGGVEDAAKGSGSVGDYSGTGDNGHGTSSTKGEGDGDGGKGGKDDRGEQCPENMAQVASHNGYFCIDLYEYPNVNGKKPVVGVDVGRAGTLCEAKGKRLCGVEEWKKACVGVKDNLYPYGNKRDKKKCNTDSGHLQPTGSHPLCVSDYHVYDLSGNAGELVSGNKESEFFIAGGTFITTEIPDSCRYLVPINHVQNEWNIGFRCCK